MEETALVQRAYTAVLEHFIKAGRAPHYAELAGILNLRPEEARQIQHKAAESAIACWFVKDTDYVESWAPFSNVPTHHLVTIGGEQKWYGQWGIEALAVRWLFPGTEIRIDTRCLDCGEPILVRMRGEDILEVNPATTVGHMNIPFARVLKGEISWGLAWSRMNLFRSEEHVKNWPLYDSVSAESIMPLSNWALAFSGPLHRNRLEPDYLSRQKEYASHLFVSLQKLGKAGPFWTPEWWLRLAQSWYWFPSVTPIGYFDLLRDPDELTNVASSLSAKKRERLHDLLRGNEECEGADACRDAQRMEPWAMVIEPGPPEDRSRFYRIDKGLRPVFILVSLLFLCPMVASTEASTSPSFAATLSYRVAPVAASSEKVSLKIMPLGDSITFGTPDRSYGGYRHALGPLLANDGYIVDFVGSQQSGNKVIPDPDNEGHSGWTIGQIKSGIDANGWLETYQPDIILLHIGTNDNGRGNAASAPGDLSALLDDILARLPRARVIVAQIIPFRWGPDQGHQSYNAAIPGIVASKGPRVSMVDMRSILSKSDYADGLHPNAAGYDKMARAWETAIRAVVDREKGVKSRLRVE